MKRFKRVKKFKRDSRGVVTVMVTLLLIPAVLISGTAVDLARIHTSRSVLHNANQLAANTVMTQYDAMIKDLYGLYGIMEDDPVLAELLDEYIMVAVFGTGEETAGLGTFQMLGGTPRDSVKNTLTPHPVQHLRNPEVIRRQIEEYMKFRAPTVIMNDLFGKIEQFTKIKNDAEAIKDKLDIDDKFSELGELYEELFLRLRFNDHYLTGGNTKGLEADIFRDINATMGTVNSYFKSMLSNRNTYMNAKRELESLSPPSSGEDSDAYEAYERRKAELEREMADSKSAYNDHDWNIYSAASGLSFRLGGYKGGSGLLGFGGLPNDFYRSTTTGRLDSYISNLGIDSSGKSRLEKLCEEIEKKTEEINGMIRKLETQQLPDCSDQLRGDEESPGIQQAINEIKEWLDMEPKPGTLVGDLNSNKEYIEAFQDWLDDSKIMYGTINSSNSLSGDTSISASLNSLKSSMFSNIEAENDDLEKFAALSTDDIEYVHFYKANPDVTMQAFVEIGDDHALLYAKLYMLYGLADEAGGDASSKKAIQKAISDMTQAAADQLNGIINRPRGGEGPAINKRIPDAAWKQLQHDKDEFEEVLKNNWSNSGNNNKTAIAALAQAIKKFFDIGAHLNNTGNHILLLTYSTEMFSNYTSRYDSDAVSLAGIPFGEDVNYLLDWEMEYLFNGSQSANANLAAVSDLMFMCRFVFNYISTFKLANVNAVLTGVQAAFAWAGPFQLVIRELTRVGLAIAESAVDVMNLRLGKDVELIKLREDEWSVLGFAALKDIALDTAQN
ncbi:MAG: DUF5702 domain-containing protein, partial [Oscillospiraceae bacterium]|nr:DUF5702 domain-containing protein [Oscillospiraceae bacterium]